MVNSKKLGMSFKYAWTGLVELWTHQQNFRIEILATIFIIAMTYVFHIRSIERALILIAILLVLGAEIVNSVFENILDGISQAKNERFRVAKDIMAGMTLIMAIGSVILAGIIFYPYIRFYFVG